MTPPRVAPVSRAKGKLLSASTLLLIAAILLAVSLGVSWWAASISGSGETATLNFLPGSSYSGSGDLGNGSFSGTTSYASAGLVQVGNLYEAVFGLALLVAITAFIGMGLGYVGASGVFRSRAPLYVALALTVVSFLGAVLLPTFLTIAQPGAFTADSSSGAVGGSGACGTGTSPCNSFWGSTSSGGETVSWGAGLGWYLALAAAVLLLIALIQLVAARRQPYTREEISAASYSMSSPQGYYVAPMSPYPQYPTGWAAPPVPPANTPVAGPVSAASIPTPPACPRCGNPLTFAPQYGRYYCWTCRAYP